MSIEECDGCIHSPGNCQLITLHHRQTSNVTSLITLHGQLWLSGKSIMGTHLVQLPLIIAD